MDKYDFDFFSDSEPQNDGATGKRPERSYAGKVTKTYEERRKIRKRKRIVRRTLTLTVIGVILVLIFTGISSLLHKCSNETPDTPSESTAPSTQTPSSGTAETPTEPKQNDSLDFTEPKINDDGTSGVFSSNIYVYKNAGYAAFVGGNEDAVRYADALIGYKKALPSNVKVYSAVVPSASEIKLPSRLAQEIGSMPQADFIKTVNQKLAGAGVTPVNVYNALALHNDEYIYYNTDSHWTALGAYYGYEEFAKIAGLEPLDLSKTVKKSVSGFLGDYAQQSGNTQLSSVPDTVDYYDYPETANVTAKILFEGENEFQDVDLYYPLAESGSLTYGVFLWSDQPLTVIQTSKTTGKNILVVKDSYGNPFAPLLAENYDNVYVVDYRRWDGNLKSYCEENSITDVLFINEIANASSSTQVDTLDTLFN